MKAARVVSDWITALIVARDHPEPLKRTLKDLLNELSHIGRIQSRSTHRSIFQIIQDPSVLEWAA